MIKRCSLILLLFLYGCASRGIPIEIYTNPPKKMKIIRPYKDKIKCIMGAIVKEGNIPDSEALMLWEDYERHKTEKINDFSKYLISIKYSPRHNGISLRDDIFVNFARRVKSRTKILKREVFRVKRR